MRLSKYKRWRMLFHRVIPKQQAKKTRLILCIYMQWISMKMWGTLINRMITKQRVKMNR